MHTHVTTPRNCGYGIRHSTVPPERRFAKVSTRPADFTSGWPTRPVVPLSETSVGLGVYVGNNPERFIGDVRWAKNHSALERSSCSCELFAIRNCFPLIVRRTRTYARTSRFTTFHLSFPFTYLTNLSAIRRIPSRSIIHLYVQKTKQSIGRSFISDLSFSGFGCI